MNQDRVITQARVDACSACQLECPLCPQSQGLIHKHLGTGYLRAVNFERFLELNLMVRQIELCNWGEAFLNPELGEIMRIAYERGVTLSLRGGTNLNRFSEELAEAVVRYQISDITIAIDGVTQRTYEQYRRRGSIEKVYKNVSMINYYKNKLGSKLPRLLWQFVPFCHNEHEIEEAKAMADRYNMQFIIKLSWDSMYLGKNFAPAKKIEAIAELSGTGVGSRDEYYNAFSQVYLMADMCSSLWRTPQVSWDGRLLGCPVNYWGDYGNAFEEPLSFLMCGAYGKAIRFVKGLETDSKGLHCRRCPHFQHLPIGCENET